MSRSPFDDACNPANALRKIMTLEPWFVLQLASVLTAEQWESLVTQTAMLNLQDMARRRAVKALQSYPRWFGRKWREDITTEVICKLGAGTFLKNYDSRVGYPMPWIVGCTYQYARTLVRSYWRRFGRDDLL